MPNLFCSIVSKAPFEWSKRTVIAGLLATPFGLHAAALDATSTASAHYAPLSESSIAKPPASGSNTARPAAQAHGRDAPAVQADVRNAVPYSTQAHDALIEGLRDDRRGAAPEDAAAADAAALEQIEIWLSQARGLDLQNRLAADGIVIAQRVGQSPRAVAIAHASNINSLPSYALVPLFQAARAVADRPVQGQTVEVMRRRTPQAWQPQIMEILWLTDTGAFDEAQRRLDALANVSSARTSEQRVQWLEAQGGLNEARQRPIEAIGNYQNVLALQPDHRYALRERVFLLARSSAAPALDLARQSVETHPGLFSDLELASLQQEALAQRLRWAIVERDQKFGHGAVRFDVLDDLLPRYEVAIAEVDTRARALAAAGNTEEAQAWREVELAMAYDRILGLSARGRHKDVLTAYEALLARDVAPPYFVLSAAAGAHQHGRRSDLAVPLYEAALQEGGTAIPVPSDTHIGLVYAYIDTARFDQAEWLLQYLERATPPLLRLTPVQGQANAQYSQIRHLRALTQLYTDHPAKAERSFEVLTSMAPLNAGFRTGEAETAALRDQPERALDLYREALTDNPDDASVRAGYANALMGAGYQREGRELSEALQSEAPQSTEARRAARENQTLRAPRLDVRADGGRGGEFSNRDWRVDSRITSGLIDDQWRVYARQVFSLADLDDDDTERFARTGLGLQWQRGRWTAGGEVHRTNHGRYRNGLAGELTYRASDAWRLSAEFDTSSLDTPYKARRADIGARSAAVGVTYVVNEARSFNASLRRMHFSDGNRRNGVGVNWRERWLTGPRWQFETNLGADTGTNSQRDTPYFNPRNDTSVGVNTRTQYLTWKRDDRRLLQVFEAGAGAYRQSGEGVGPQWSLAYSHEWLVGSRYQLSYGVGIASHPYDGERETRRTVFLNLSVPLQ